MINSANTFAQTPQEHPLIEFKTSAGNFVIRLECEGIPITCDNFLSYVTDGFYNNTLIHRVVENFIIQMGGYSADFQSKSARKSIKQERTPNKTHKKWTVAMALALHDDSARSQFFINMKENSEFNFSKNKSIKKKGYTVFGKVISGYPVLTKINQAKTGPYRYFSKFYNRYIDIEEVPLKPIIINETNILNRTTNESVN